MSDPIALEDLDQMTPEEIVSAKHAGRLDHLLNPTRQEN